ncbi:integrase core domain-containing protein [Gimesia sp.]|uniref:integrase core domain-containing protein n=1 Tax=Gimesia sp. TaxID=2024833 RepID=UPI003A8EEA09
MAESTGDQLVVSRAGSPLDKWLCGKFQQSIPDELLAVEVFEKPGTACRLTTVRQEDYNGQRRHGSLGDTTPAEFASRCAVSNRAAPSFPLHSEIT